MRSVSSPNAPEGWNHCSGYNLVALVGAVRLVVMDDLNASALRVSGYRVAVLFSKY